MPTSHFNDVEFTIPMSAYREADDSADADIADLLQATEINCKVESEADMYDGEPFAEMAKSMTNVTADGRVRKKIIRPGIKPVPENATVLINYEAFEEYALEPFDSTYNRKNAYKCQLNNGELLPGLDLALQSMAVHERAHFLVHPSLAYGNNYLGRVPHNSTVLFAVELEQLVEPGASRTFKELPPQRQRLFSELNKFCAGQCDCAKALFGERKYTMAIREYNIASSTLDAGDVEFERPEDTMELIKLRVRIYSNLLLCYSLDQKPKKGCVQAQRIFAVTQDGELLAIGAKVYFNHAKCLRQLGQFEEAEEQLKKAHNLEPHNESIASEFLVLAQERARQHQHTKRLAQALLTPNASTE